MKKLERNVHVWSPGANGEEIAGFYQHGGVSVSMFRRWIEMVCTFESEAEWGLYKVSEGGKHAEEHVVDRQEAPHDATMPKGDFVILKCQGLEPLNVVNSPDIYLARTLSFSSTATERRTTDFTGRLRSRDGGCCITGLTEDENMGWQSLEACHIFPRAHIDIWRREKFEDLIEDTHPASRLGDQKIDSIQNGLILESSHHRNFDANMIAVDPDDDYKIIDFRKIDFRKIGNLHGKQMKINGETPAERPLDILLKYHLKQSVFKNIRGAAEVLDDDPEDDWTNADTLRMDNEKLATTVVGRFRLEMELGARLNHLVS